MKVKTSITLTKVVLEMIDAAIGKSGNRSEFIEQAVEHYIRQQLKEQRERHDLDILNHYTDRLNREAKDVLSYQIEL
jgi:metal-responsive CopG/Arc/MetJ family transcriptional regulator